MQDFAKTLEVVLSVSLALFASWILLRPLLVPEAVGDSRQEELERLLLAKEIAMSSLEELEQDYLSGKMEQGDYDRLKSELSAKAVALMQQIDSLPSN